jgi:glycosyl transferase, family 25
MHRLEAQDSAIGGARGAAAAMPIYCINLDKRPDRLAHMRAQAREVGVALTRMPAVDAASPEIQEAVATRAAGATGLRMGAGAIACFESHRACWRALLDSDAGHAILLEDDVLLAADFAAVACPGWVPADADVVKLETWGVRVNLGRRHPNRIGPRELRRLHSTHFGSAGYVISRRAAERLLVLTENACDPIDNTLFSPDQPIFSMLLLPDDAGAGGPGKKQDEPTAPAAWTDSSITERFLGDDPVGAAAERRGIAARLRQRLAAEWQARLRGLSYARVAHG